MQNYEEEKARELLSDVTAPTNMMSNCCSGRLYMPTDEWSQCMTCMEYCEVVTFEDFDDRKKS
jgi:hypothetical protein